MRRDAPSPCAEPIPFDRLTFARPARAFEWFADPTGAAMLLYAPHRFQQGDASTSNVTAIAQLYGVKLAALIAAADVQQDCRLCQIEANAGRLRRNRESRGLPAYSN